MSSTDTRGASPVVARPVARIFRSASLILLAFAQSALAAPDAATVRFWDRCIAAVENRPPGERVVSSGTAAPMAVRGPLLPACSPRGGVAASVQDWQGSVFVPRATVDQVLDSLFNNLPQQEDVVAAQFLARSPGSVRVYLRLVRHKLITVTYDTEHEMTFERRSSALASSRSVMTRIAEVDDAGTPRERLRAPGNDRGFLWKLNSYATYTQHPTGVAVRMESVTLSRDVPLLLRPIAAPIVDSIARESMLRTLEALQRRFARR